MSSSYRLCAGLAIAVLVASTSAQAARADKLDDILNIRGSTHNENQQAQQQVDKPADETKDLLGEYRVEVQKVDSLKVFNAQIRKLIASQEEEMSKLQADIEGVSTIERDILPLMGEMVAVLAQFVEGDLPFLLEERRARVTRIRELLDRADVTTAAKYPPPLQAFQVRQHQLGLDRGGVPHRIDPVIHMRDAAVLEAAQHMGDRVDLAYICQKPVSEPVTPARSFDQPRDVDKGYPGGNRPPRAGDAREGVKARVGNRHLADIGIDRAERKIRRLRHRRPRQRVEQRRLAHVGKPNDSGTKPHAPRLP